MKRPSFSRSLLLLLALLFGQHPAVAQTVRYVDNLTGCASLAPCYPTIMEAVNAAAPSDSIRVFPGVYHEAVVLSSKDHLTLKTHQEILKPVIAAPPGGRDAVSITASQGVRIEGFVLEAPEAAAVSAFGAASSNAVIQGNVVKSLNGLNLVVINSCVVKNNTFIGSGISFPQGASGCSIEGNRLIDAGISFNEGFTHPNSNVIRYNIIRGGGVVFGGRGVSGNIVESNLIDDGGIGFGGINITSNTIRGNVVRGGGIFIGDGADHNAIESNFVSGSAGDGIHVRASRSGGSNVIMKNTSVENAGCDLNDSSDPLFPMNVWEMNRFVTKCGAATN